MLRARVCPLARPPCCSDTAATTPTCSALQLVSFDDESVEWLDLSYGGGVEWGLQMGAWGEQPHRQRERQQHEGGGDLVWVEAWGAKRRRPDE